MKNATNTLLIVTCISLIFSCINQGNPTDLIVNTWKLKEFEPAARFPMPDSVKQRIIEMTVAEYTADGNFRQTGISRTHTGTYTISSDGKLIRYVMNDKDTQRPFTDTIITLTRNKLKVIDQNGNRLTRVPK